MKTTVDITESILEEARKLAARNHTTVKALVEEGLRRIIADRKRAGTFKLRKVSFKGKGLQPHLTDASWESVREITYKGRGG